MSIHRGRPVGGGTDEDPRRPDVQAAVDFQVVEDQGSRFIIEVIGNPANRPLPPVHDEDVEAVRARVAARYAAARARGA